MKIAILGANGFVGSRLVEMFHLGRVADVRPIVRTFGGLAGLAKFDLDWKVSDALDRTALQEALKGCDAVVSCVNGNAATIVESASALYDAAERAGVRRLIYLSSFVVHGQAPPAGTTEDSEFRLNSGFWYNDAKIQAEQNLRELRKRGKVELVILRPGIIFGPRSPRWTAGLAAELIEGRAALVGNGEGVCNSIYVDNLVHAIRLSIEAKEADGEAFFVGDRERVTWFGLYSSLGRNLGIDGPAIPRIARPEFPPDRVSLRERFDFLLCQPQFQAAVRIFPKRLKHPIRAAISTYLTGGRVVNAASPWAIPRKPEAAISKELCLLQECTWALPQEKALRLLGYQAPVSFEEGCGRSLAWLEFAGFRRKSRVDVPSGQPASEAPSGNGALLIS